VNFKVAFIGDQGLNVNSVAVLNLIKNEGAQVVMHQGDFGYSSDTAAWETQINNVLGANFPYFGSIGNHDASTFRGPTGYQQLLINRFNRLGIAWNGDLGVQSSFHYQGIFFVLTASGITNFDTGNMDIYIRDQLALDNSIWSISSWHKDMSLMQVGGKSDETGWGVYEESRAGGAIIATGHEHSYERTHLLSSMINQTVASTSNTLTLTKGNSFAFVSGLGGESVRVQSLGGPWWASIYTLTCLVGDPVCQSNANYGALFGVFNVDGQVNKAFFYFKDINGLIVDSFTVISNVEPTPTPTPTP
jgi:predicted phosphodiesterase